MSKYNVGYVTPNIKRIIIPFTGSILYYISFGVHKILQKVVEKLTVVQNNEATRWLKIIGKHDACIVR